MNMVIKEPRKNNFTFWRVQGRQMRHDAASAPWDRRRPGGSRVCRRDAGAPRRRQSLARECIAIFARPVRSIAQWGDLQ